MARTSNLANVATVSRASKAWYPGGWDFTSGSAITGDLTEYANNIARDGTSGLLVEEGSTNEIRNPRFEGGSLNVEPTNMEASPSVDGATTFEFGYENGWPYWDVIVDGDTGGFSQISLEGLSQIVAASGQSWTFSLSIRLMSGSVSDFSTLQLRIREGTAAGAFVRAEDQDVSATLDGTHRRVFVSIPSLDASTERVAPQLNIDTDGSVQATLRIYAPQLEQKAYPTSPILPPAGSPAASTRNADEINVDGGAWINSNGGTLYCHLTLNSQHTDFDRSVAYISDNSYNNRLFLGVTTDGKIRGGGYTPEGNTNTEITVSPVLAAGVSTKAAVATFSNEGGALSASGGTQSTDATLGDYNNTLDRLDIGSDHSAANPINAYIKDIRYWPRRLTNAELEALVGN